MDLRGLGIRAALHRLAGACRCAAATATATTAASLAAPGSLLLAGLQRLLRARLLPLLLLLGTRLLRLPGCLLLRARPIGIALLLLLLPRLLTSLLLALLRLAGTGTLPAASALARLLLVLLGALAAPRPAGALFVLADLLVHEAHRLPRLLQAHFVMPAIRAAPPSLGIGLFTGGAKNAFRERHR